jgi:hypothetical protein
MNESNIAVERRPQASAQTPAINVHLASVWGAFLHEGLMLNGKNAGRSSAILALWGQGCVELIMSVCEFIPTIWQQVQPYWFGQQGFPGVFEYEVVSTLGEQLGSYILEHDGDLPSPADVEQMIAELVVTFFSQGGTFETSSEQEPQTERLMNLHSRFTECLTQQTGGES